jgi:integrase
VARVELTIRCPQCGSEKTWRDGIRYSGFGQVQRYICRNCGYRFSDPESQQLQKRHIWLQIEGPKAVARTQTQRNFNALTMSEHAERILTKPLKSSQNIPLDRQICVTKTKGAKNLAAAENQTQAAGIAPQQPADVKGKIVEFMWKLKREAYAEATITGYAYILETLLKRGANLYDPENVKDIIAKQDTWSSARKNQVAKAYTVFLKMHGLKWSMPKYKVAQKLPFIPIEEEIDQLIAGCSSQMATFLQVLKETAARCGEAFILKWTDIDLVTNTVRITPEKSSNPRVCKISNKLAGMLANLPKKCMTVFGYKSKFYLRKTFLKQRKRLAYKLGNPRLLQIHFHTLRHWKATMEYHKTKDILHVMQLLGHKNIKNTLIYTQLINFQDDDYICKTAKTLTEATQLIEAGFEYITEMDNIKLFRKRK